MKNLFDQVSIKCSRITTHAYSTSFSLGTRFLHPSIREGIYSIYGFVRFADEIVDTFHDYDKAALLADFRTETFKAIAQGISLNPILNSFQHAVNKYHIGHDLIETFLESMQMDLKEHKYDRQTYEKYILGSAEVVGLMCLRVFVQGDEKKYQELKHAAMKLGAAFQKINFLRDVQHDAENLGRMYFPGVNIHQLSPEDKQRIEEEIEIDFAVGYSGIIRLPKKARFGVYLAYVYFFGLLKRIQATPVQRLFKERIRIPDTNKYALFVGSYVRHNLGML
jgi:phytoene/squalene synthetase